MFHNMWRGDESDNNWSEYFKPKGSMREVHFSKRVRVVKEDGTVLADVPVVGLTSDFNSMKTQYGKEKVEVSGDEKSGLVETVIVNEELIECVDDITLLKKSPMMCLYTAIEDYCSSLFGVKLCEEDRTFFKEHPLAQDDGVPFPDTLRVAQELIAPYGLRVSRVQTAQNFGVKGDLLQWRKVLGCNPLAMGDRITSNAEFVEKLGLQGKEDPSKYRFEYTNTALFPAISCGTVSGGYASGTTGSSGGHAVYVAPRKRANGALLSFQIARAEHVIWRAEPQFAPFPEDGQKIVKCFELNTWWTKFRPQGSYSSSSNLPVINESAKPKCYMCHRKDKDRKHTMAYPGICDECYMLFLGEMQCAKIACQDTTTKPYPEFTFEAFHVTGAKVYLKCRGCYQHYVVTTANSKGKQVARFIKSLEAYMKANKLKHYSVRGPSTANADDLVSSGD